MAAPIGENEFVSEAIIEDKLVDVWPEYPCLYDVRIPQFKNRDSREKAIEKIARKVNQSQDWVKAKIKSLRNSYTKAKKPQSSGSARKSQTKRTAWLLEKLQFLAPYIASRASISNMDSPPATSTASASDDEDLDDSFLSEPEPIINRSTKQPLKERPSSTKKLQAEEELKLIKTLTTSIAERGNKRKRADDDNISSVDVFGRYVTKSLSELNDPRMRHLAEFKINDILFKARMESLGQYENQPLNNWPTTEYQPLDPYRLTQI